MKVRTTIAMHGFPSCSTLELDDAEAASLIAGGFATPSTEPALNIATPTEPAVRDEPQVETADAVDGDETADAPSSPARKPVARKPRKSASSSS